MVSHDDLKFWTKLGGDIPEKFKHSRNSTAISIVKSLDRLSTASLWRVEGLRRLVEYDKPRDGPVLFDKQFVEC
jgi:hypothetical protein